MKLLLDSRPIQRKRRMHMCHNVSQWCEEFSCEGEMKVRESFRETINNMVTGRRERPPVVYGISKKEDLVSDYYGANGHRDSVGV